MSARFWRAIEPAAYHAAPVLGLALAWLTVPWLLVQLWWRAHPGLVAAACSYWFGAELARLRT